MTATVIDGKCIACEIQKEVSQEIKGWSKQPKLTVILVGNDPASEVYVNRKKKVCEEVGIQSELFTFPANVEQYGLIEFVKHLKTDGILVQLPLPSEIPTEGRRITIINRSQVVGQPLALMLQQEPYNATVTVCHEYTKNLSLHTLDSDIVVTAVGKYPNFELRPDWLPKGGTVIDVAMNRVEGKLFGDVVDFDAAKERVQYITPVPGGVGPLTVAMLMKNTLTAAKIRRNLIRS